MFDITVNFFKNAGEWGLNLMGIAFLCMAITFIVLTGFMVLFLIFKQVFFPKQAKAEPMHYTLLKNLALPFIMSLVKDVSKAANDKVEANQKSGNKDKEAKK